ncbi:MAG: glycosyltransferase family 2 protein [Rhodospirillales bacterium]
MTASVMAAPPEVTIFVPCFNEASRVEATIETIKQGCADVPFEIVVSNDGSTDGTAERVRAAQQANPDISIKLLDSKVNRGLGYFFLAAAYVASGTYYIFIPGDNVVPAATIRQILSHRGQADIIIPYFADIDPRPICEIAWNVSPLRGGYRVES